MVKSSISVTVKDFLLSDIFSLKLHKERKKVSTGLVIDQCPSPLHRHLLQFLLDKSGKMYPKTKAYYNLIIVLVALSVG